MIEEILNQLRAHMEGIGNDYSVVLRPAGWSSIDRIEIEFRDGKRISRFLAKAARLPAASDHVRREASVLAQLKEMQVKDVPEIVFDGQYGGLAFFVERFVDGVRLKDVPMAASEAVRLRLEWIRTFYSSTRGREIDPRDLIKRADEACRFVNGYVDLTEALSVMERCKPEHRIQTVCWHGDASTENFLSARNGLVAVDFGFSRFDEAPADPYAIVDPSALRGKSKLLEDVAGLSGADPFFFAIYGNLVHLAEQLREQELLDHNLLLVNRLREFPSRELANIEDALQYYKQSG